MYVCGLLLFDWKWNLPVNVCLKTMNLIKNVNPK